VRELLERLVGEMVDKGIRYEDAQREFEKRFITRVVEARDGTTNALGLPYPEVFRPLYGPGSAARFVAHALRLALDYEDQYREAVLEVVERKAAGKNIEPPEDVETVSADDLLAALEASLAKA